MFQTGAARNHLYLPNGARKEKLVKNSDAVFGLRSLLVFSAGTTNIGSPTVRFQIIIGELSGRKQ